MQKEKRIGKTISHYKITELLGGGGMGIVYKAEDLKLKRTVALKFLPVEFTQDEQSKVRFMHEAQAASALDHPRIGTIYEIDETEDGEMFIAMAYYEGETLKTKMEREDLTIEEVTSLTIQIANGLAEAHQQGIVHRDIKPANIIITKDGFVKIVDFGLAKLGGATRITKAGTSMGTPAYMSPEQVRGKEIDHKSDIWSLGVILYELLTKKLPFQGDYEMALLYSIVHEKPAEISEYNPNVPFELEQIIRRAISKDNAERYDSIQDMLKDLNEFQTRFLQTTDGMQTVVLNRDQNIPAPTREKSASAEIIDAKQTIPISTAGDKKGRAAKSKLFLFASLVIVVAVVGWIISTQIRSDSKPGIGFLELKSNPSDAAISLDDTPTGKTTPAIIGPLAHGTYKVSLFFEGFAEWSENLAVETNDTLSVTPQLTAMAAGEKKELETTTETNVGILSINSNPKGVQIYLDGRRTNKVTPALIDNLSAGNHQIQLKFQDRPAITKTVTVLANQTTEISETLELVQGSLSIDSRPQGALVFINENSTKQITPQEFSKLSPGDYTIRLTLEGYKDYETRVQIKANKLEKLNPALKENPGGKLKVLAVLESGLPAVANIYVDGKAQGQTPGILSLKSGTYTITAKLFGHTPKEAEKKVIIQSGKEETIKFEFLKK